MSSDYLRADQWRRRFFLLLGISGVLFVAVLLLLVVLDLAESDPDVQEMVGALDQSPAAEPDRNQSSSQAPDADDRSSGAESSPGQQAAAQDEHGRTEEPESSVAELEGRILSIDRPSRTLRVRVVESEVAGDRRLGPEVVVQWPETSEPVAPVQLGSLIEAEGRYFHGSNVLYASRVEFEDEQSSASEVNSIQEREQHEQSEPATEDHESGRAERDEDDGRYEQSQESDRQDFEASDVEEQAREDQQAEHLQQEREDEQELQEHEQEGQELNEDGADRDHEQVTSYAEFEGRVVAVDDSAHTFRLRVHEAEYVRGITIPTEVTVALSQSWRIPGWLTAGQYVEVEGRYATDDNVLYAAEIEREDD